MILIESSDAIYNHDMLRIWVTPKRSLAFHFHRKNGELYDVKTFQVGDAFNALFWAGHVKVIGPKNVTIGNVSKYCFRPLPRGGLERVETFRMNDMILRYDKIGFSTEGFWFKKVEPRV